MADETVFQKAPQQFLGPIDFEYLRSLTNAPPVKEMEEDEKEEDKPPIDFEYLRSLTNAPPKKADEPPSPLRQFEQPLGPDVRGSDRVPPMYEDELMKSHGLKFSGSKKHEGNVVKGVPFMSAEKERGFIPKEFPHPSLRRVAGMSERDQEQVWMRLSGKGREEFEKRTPQKFINPIGREEEKHPSKVSQLTASQMKKARVEARKPYETPKDWEGKRGQVSRWAFGLADSNPKRYGKRDHWERHGIIGGLIPDTLLLSLLGQDEAINKKFMEEMRGAGTSGVAAYKGYKYGAPLGTWGKIIGGFTGAALGKVAGDATSGKLSTAGEQIEYGLYGTLPIDKVTGAMAKNYFRRVLVRGTEGAVVNEGALQAQSVLDEGKSLPVDPQSIITRNLAMFFMNGGLGAIQGASRAEGKSVLDSQGEMLNAFASDTLKAEKSRLLKKIQGIKTEIKSDRGASGKQAAQRRRTLIGNIQNEVDYINSKLFRADKGEPLITGQNDELRLSQVLSRAVRNKNIVGNLDGMLEITKPAIIVAKGAKKGANELSIVEGQISSGDSPPAIKDEKAGGFMSFFGKARHQLMNEHGAISSLHGLAKKMGLAKDPNRSDLGTDFDLLHTARGKGQAKVLHHDQHVTKKVSEAGLSDDFDKYLFIKRIESRLKDGNARKSQLDEVSNLLDAIKKEHGDVPPKELKEYVSELKGVQKSLKSRSDKRVAAAIDGSGEVIYWTPEMAGNALKQLKDSVGNEGWKKLEGFGESFQQSSRRMLRDLEKGGIVSKEQRLDMEARNVFYAPFMLDKYLSKTVAGRSGDKKVLHAITGIDDPLMTIASPNESFRNRLIDTTLSIEHNLAKLEFVNEMEKTVGKDMGEGMGPFLRKLKKTGDTWESVPEGGSEGVFHVMRNGELEQYAVDGTVAKAIESFGGNASKFRESWAGRFLHQTSKPFKVGTTKWSVPFQLVNALASDLPTNAITSEYGLKANPVDWARFVGDYANSFVLALRGQQKNPPKEYIELLKSGFLGNTLRQAIDPVYEASRRLPRYDGRLVGSTGSKIMQAGGKVGSYIDILPDAIEEMGKIVAIKRAARHHGVGKRRDITNWKDVTDWESFARKNPELMRKIRTEITTQAGSPQFSKIGEKGKDLDLLFMFYNARMQGAARDVARLAGQEGGISGNAGKKAWARLGLAVGAPTTALIHRNLTEYAEDYAMVPERIKENNWIFFRDNYITDEDGKNLMRDYWTLPKRDIVKALANIAEGVVTMALREDPDRSWKDIAKESASIGLRAAGDVAPVDPIPAGESTLLQTLASQSHPFPKAWAEFTGGAEGQITDTWMGRELIPERFLKADPEHQKTESTEQGYVIVGQALGVSPIGVKKLVKTFTGNLIGQFVPKKPVEGRENWENDPLLRFFGQRFIAPNFIQDDKAKKWIDEELNKEANKNAIAGDAANKWIDERLRGQEIQIWDTKDDLILQLGIY